MVYWQAVLAADAKEEVSWSWSDGPGLDPAVALAATNASRAATAAARTGAAIAAGVEAARVNCRESPVPGHLKLGGSASGGLSRRRPSAPRPLGPDSRAGVSPGSGLAPFKPSPLSQALDFPWSRAAFKLRTEDGGQ